MQDIKAVFSRAKGAKKKSSGFGALNVMGRTTSIPDPGNPTKRLAVNHNYLRGKK